ncbi:MAG: tetratricopeptide repeat protein, partial [Myxococcota bacterium]
FRLRHSDLGSSAETQFQEASRLADALRLNFDERAVFETERASYLLEARRHDEALNALNTVMNQPDFDKDLSLERRATLHGIRAEILRTLGDFDQSLVHVERALKLHEESTLNVVDKADTYRLAAGIYSDLGQLDRSEELERTGLGESLKRHGPDDRRTLVSRNNLALLLKNRGRFSDSEEMLSEVLASQQRTLGAEHPDAGATLFNLAEAQLHQKKYSQALGAYLRAVKNVETHFPNSPRVAVNRVIYPRALGRAGRIDEARETFASGLELAPAGNPPHPLTGRLRVEYAGFLNEQSQFPEALAELGPVVPVLRETYGPASREYALAQYQRGISLQDAPEGREALSLALRILSDSPFRERYRAEIDHCSTLLNRSPGQ